MAKYYKLMLKQSIGVPAAPVVKKGASVKKGTLLAQPDGLGVPLHASVAGKITEITDTYIEIETAAKQTAEFEPIPQSDISTPAGIIEMVKASGLCGMGGAGFPTYVKLGTKLDGGYIMVNAAECEPMLKHNIKEIIAEPAKIYRGIQLAMQATGAAKGIMCLKAKNTEAIAAFKKVIKPGDNIEVAELADMYPMGEERAIVREVLGTLLGVDQLPAAANAVILNVETIARITEAVDQRRPVISKHVTVFGKLGHGTESQVFMDMPIGTPVSELVEMGGGFDGPHGELIMGGPFTGKPTQMDAPIMKNTGAIIVTMEYPKEKRPVGLLVCACGGNEDRLRQIAEKMEAKIVGVQKCKQAHEVKGALKCENPGNCPGQAEKIMELKKAGAQAVLCSNCSDCTNTVMCVAPKLKMAVHHQTDTVMRTVGHSLIRRLPIEN